jgi:hypothetical protein
VYVNPGSLTSKFSTPEGFKKKIPPNRKKYLLDSVVNNTNDRVPSSIRRLDFFSFLLPQSNDFFSFIDVG